MVSSPSAAAPSRRQIAITPASIILVCVSALLAIGLAVLYSASSRAVGGPTSYLYKQLIFLALAIGGGWVMARVDLEQLDRKSTRLNSSHLVISYAVFCLKKKNT